MFTQHKRRHLESFGFAYYAIGIRNHPDLINTYDVKIVLIII